MNSLGKRCGLGWGYSINVSWKGWQILALSYGILKKVTAVDVLAVAHGCFGHTEWRQEKSVRRWAGLERLHLLLHTWNRYLLSGKMSSLILAEVWVHVSLVLFGAFHNVQRCLCQEISLEPDCREYLLQSVKAAFTVLEIAQGLPCAFIGQSIFLKNMACRCLLQMKNLASEFSVHILTWDIPSVTLKKA